LKYKLIALDLDDTLLDKDIQISSANYKALEEAHKQGVKIVLCTGRPEPSVKAYVDQLPFLDETDAYVSFNGAMITTVGGKDLFKEVLSNSLLSDLTDIARLNSLNLQLYNEDTLLVELYNETTIKYENLSGMKATTIGDLKSLDYSLKALFNSTDTELLESIRIKLEEKYKTELTAFYSKPYYLEVLNINGNKGLAIKHLAEHYGLDASEIIAVGDSFNDIYMIEYAGLGVAVENARQPIKDVADYVTIADHNNSAVAEVINKFILEKTI